MYNRRIKIFLAIAGVTFLVLAARLGHLQLVRGDEYRLRFERSLRHVRLLAANRGRILDRTGQRPLAEDVPCFDFALEYGFLVEDPRWIARRQRRIADDEHVSAGRAAEIYRERAERTWQFARMLAEGRGEDLDRSVADVRDRVAAVREAVGGPVREEYEAHPVVRGLDDAVALDGLVGAELQPSKKRWYPFGELTCHLVGITGPVYREDLDARNLTAADEPDPLARRLRNYLPGDRIGKRGAELACEEVLRGRRGYRRFKRTTGGPEVLEAVAPEHGRDLVLTVDLALQSFLKDRMAGLAGAAVVLSVPDGEVLASVSVPGYDPNRYWQDAGALLGDEVLQPVRNRAVWWRYPPGSTAKPVAALAGLSTGEITPETTFFCRGYLHQPNAFRCWIYARTGGGHGRLDLDDAIKDSCNVYFYHVGETLGARQMSMWLHLFGFADPPGVHLPEERAGTVATEAWLARHRPGQPRFTVGDGRMFAIGQGPFLATPMHVANAMAAIARGGELSAPVLILERRADGRLEPFRPDGPQPAVRLPVTAAQVAVVQRGMYRVVNDATGTSYKYFHGPGVTPPGVDVCGKTGTAQTAPQRVDSNGNGRIDGGDRIVRSGDTAWFAGFAPYENPRIAFAIAVEYVESGGGASNAGPIAHDLVAVCRELGYLP